MALTTQPQLAPKLKIQWSYTTTSPPSLRGLLQGELYRYLHLM